MNNFSTDCAEVQTISGALHQGCAAAGHSVLWLAMDGADRPLPELEPGLTAWAARESKSVMLRHPEIDEMWWPKWYALRLDRADDCHLLNHSISWALDEAQPASIRQGHGRRVAGWLLMDASVEATHHWAQAMIRTQPRRNGRVLLRLHDPAVLWSVWRVLTPAQQNQWLGPVRSWWLLNPMAQLTHLQSAPASAGESGVAQAEPLDAMQWQSIEHITVFNHGLQARLGRSGKPTAEALETLLIDGMSALRRARHLGIDDALSLALFCELALTQHPQFDQHPRVKALLSHYSPELPLGGLISDLTPADWQAIAAELAAPK